MKQLLIAVGLSLAFASTSFAKEETKDVKVGNKTVEVRVPKSAKIDCKKEENKTKVECKKPSKAMPKVEKPKAEAPKDKAKK